MLWITDNTVATTYKKQEKIAVTQFFAKLPNFVAKFATCLLTQSLVVWSDFISSFQNILRNFIVAVISHKIKNEAGEKYNYGVEKVDIFASIMCEFIMVLGSISLVGFSINRIIYPSLPSDNMFIFLILKVLNIFSDIYILKQQSRIAKKVTSKINQMELNTYKAYLIDDSVLMVVTIVVFFFRKYIFTAYLAPIYCLVSSIYFVYTCLLHMRTNINELTDRALPVDIQDQIIDIILDNREGCLDKINAVQSKIVNEVTKIDLNLSFKPNTTYAQEIEFLDMVEEKVAKIMDGVEICIVLQKD